MNDRQLALKVVQNTTDSPNLQLQIRILGLTQAVDARRHASTHTHYVLQQWLGMQTKGGADAGISRQFGPKFRGLPGTQLANSVGNPPRLCLRSSLRSPGAEENFWEWDSLSSPTETAIKHSFCSF